MYPEFHAGDLSQVKTRWQYEGTMNEDRKRLSGTQETIFHISLPEFLSS
jgi:hypothetical protein